MVAGSDEETQKYRDHLQQHDAKGLFHRRSVKAVRMGRGK